MNLFCCGIFVAQQAVGRLILLNLGEASCRGIEAVVGVVVVTLADLAKQHCARAGLNGEVVIQPLIDVDAFARSQTNLSSGGDGVLVAVAKRVGECNDILHRGKRLCRVARLLEVGKVERVFQLDFHIKRLCGIGQHPEPADMILRIVDQS